MNPQQELVRLNISKMYGTDIEKGKKAQIGEIRTHGGKKVKKMPNGKWMEVSEHGMTRKEHNEKLVEMKNRGARPHADKEDSREWNLHTEKRNSLSDKEYDENELETVKKESVGLHSDAKIGEIRKRDDGREFKKIGKNKWKVITRDGMISSEHHQIEKKYRAELEENRDKLSPEEIKSLEDKILHHSLSNNSNDIFDDNLKTKGDYTFEAANKLYRFSQSKGLNLKKVKEDWRSSKKNYSNVDDYIREFERELKEGKKVDYREDSKEAVRKVEDKDISGVSEKKRELKNGDKVKIKETLIYSPSYGGLLPKSEYRDSEHYQEDKDNVEEEGGSYVYARKGETFIFDDGEFQGQDGQSTGLDEDWYS